MIQIREHIFETNSSSTHSLSLCKKAEFEKWKTGKLLYRQSSGTFIDGKFGIAKNTKLLKQDQLEMIDCEYYGDKDRELFSDERIELYNKGELKLSDFKIDRHNLEDYYCDFDTWYDYISRNFEVVIEGNKIDNQNFVIFGYFGYD